MSARLNVWCFRNNLSKMCLWAVLPLFPSFCRATTTKSMSVYVPIISHSLDFTVKYKRIGFVFFLHIRSLLFIVSIFTFAFVCPEPTEHLIYIYTSSIELHQIGRQRRRLKNSFGEAIGFVNWMVLKRIGYHLFWLCSCISFRIRI